MKINLAKMEKEQKADIVALSIGILAACLFCLGYFLCGTDSYVVFHDQLDGEVINYIYQAKYFFSGSDVIPEFMNGMLKSSMTVPAPIGILFYLCLPPFYAFAVMHLFVLIVGFIGFYLLLKKITKNPIIATCVSCLFIYLPFYSVYGLAIYGQPLLIWALWQIYDSGKIKIRYLLCVLLYTISSSLALIGYTWVGILLLVIAVLAIRKKDCKGLIVAWCVMTGTYVVTNMNLIMTFLGGNDAAYRNHREEMVVSAIDNIIGYGIGIFFKGVSYSFSYNMIITLLAGAIIVIYPIIKKVIRKEKMNGYYWGITCMFVANMILTGFATLWHMGPVVNMRNNAGGFIKTFQLDRITWILPMSWYIILALCIMLLLREIKKKAVGNILAGLLLLLVGIIVLKNSTAVDGMKYMLKPDAHEQMSWDDFYAPDVYQQIDAFIGEDKASYRTVSLGLPPAAALYNGFYCLDGYSNFYSLEYKHQFRKIIAKELEKSEEVRLYFDEWGNRCYLLNAETGNYMMLDKYNTGTYKQLELDVEQLKSMGAKYIFAGIKIENADSLGLELLREEPFATEESYYGVWLYKIRE